MARALPRLEWAHPDNMPSLEGDRPFTPAAYEAFVGADPEWVVGGSLRGHDPALEAIEAPTLVVCGRWDGLTLPSIAAACAQRIERSRWHVFEESCAPAVGRAAHGVLRSPGGVLRETSRVSSRRRPRRVARSATACSSVRASYDQKSRSQTAVSPTPTTQATPPLVIAPRTDQRSAVTPART